MLGRKKGRRRMLILSKVSMLVLKDTGMYKQLLCKASKSKFSSLACQARHFFWLVHQTSKERSFTGDLPRAAQGLYKLWETQRINSPVTPAMFCLCALHQKKASYRNLQLISSVLDPGYCWNTALYRFHLCGRHWGFGSAQSPNVRTGSFRVSLEVIITSARYVVHTEAQQTLSQCHSIDTVPVLEVFGSPENSHNFFKLTRWSNMRKPAR